MPKMPSEYAAISPSKQKLGDEVRMSSAQDEYEDEGDGRVESKEAIDKMTAKYDSLEKLRSSLEELRIVDGDDVTRSRTSINVYRFNEDNGIPSDQELAQVESFFSGHKTSVYVCPSMTSVYFSSLESHTLPIGHHHLHNGLDRGSHHQQRRHSGWQLVHCGIPVLLLDSGETRSRAKRRIQIVVAERGTGFLLWRDTIDNLTNYQAIDSHFHTMYMSSDHRRLVGISFHSVAGAREFYERVERLTSDPANISLSTPNKKHRQQQHNTVNNNNNNSGGHHKKRKKTMPKKSDISQPCCFQHVTRLEMADKDYYVTLATLTGRVHPPKANADNKTELHKYKSEPTLRINHLN